MTPISRVALATGLANLLLPPALVIYARLTGRPYWDVFYWENNAITWFSSGQLLLVGAIGFLIYRRSTARRWIWLIFALGFAFLALDEAFQIHEAIREHLLKPQEVMTHNPWVAPGDVGLYLYFGVGLFFTIFLYRELRRHPPAVWTFCGALALSLSIVVIDALPEAVTDEWGDGYFFTSVYEEVGEIWAQFLFLLSFLIVLHARIRSGALSGSKT